MACACGHSTSQNPLSGYINHNQRMTVFTHLNSSAKKGNDCPIETNKKLWFKQILAHAPGTNVFHAKMAGEISENCGDPVQVKFMFHTVCQVPLFFWHVRCRLHMFFPREDPSFEQFLMMAFNWTWPLIRTFRTNWIWEVKWTILLSSLYGKNTMPSLECDNFLECEKKHYAWPHLIFPMDATPWFYHHIPENYHTHPAGLPPPWFFFG